MKPKARPTASSRPIHYEQGGTANKQSKPSLSKSPGGVLFTVFVVCCCRNAMAYQVVMRMHLSGIAAGLLLLGSVCDCSDRRNRS
jgi:hypothetical protein